MQTTSTTNPIMRVVAGLHPDISFQEVRDSLVQHGVRPDLVKAVVTVLDFVTTNRRAGISPGDIQNALLGRGLSAVLVQAVMDRLCRLPDPTPPVPDTVSDHPAGSTVLPEDLAMRPPELINRADQLCAAGQRETAAELYRSWLAHHATHPLAHAIHFNHATLLTRLARLPAAKEAFSASIHSNPAFHPAYLGLGNVLAQMGDRDGATACWQHLVDRLPTSNPQTISYKLSALQHLAQKANSPTTRLFADGACRAMAHTLGVAELISIADQLRAAGPTKPLADLYSIWLEHNASNRLSYLVYFNYGTFLNANRDPQTAQTALREAIRLNPYFYPAYINLGHALERLGAPQEATEYAQQVVRHLSAITGESIKLKLAALKLVIRMGSLAQMEDAFRESLTIHPDQPEIARHWIAHRQGQCQWPVMQPVAECSKLRLLKATAPLSMAYYTDDPLLQLANAAHSNRAEVGQPPRSLLDTDTARRQDHPSPRLRIGYLSTDLRGHAVGFLTAEIYELHDRAKVELFLYYIGIPDASPFHHRIRSAADHWIDLRGLSDEEAARRMAADKIDILVDLNGHTDNARSRLLAMRPAPILVNWLGYPGTMGSPYHHYIIADDFIIPKHHEIYYSERVMRLPCYQPNDRQRLVAATRPTRQEAGLPEEGMVYSCLNGAQKITPFIWQLWMNILQQVPGSVLWLLNESDTIKNRLAASAVQHGIAADRLIFASRTSNPAHVARFPLSDLVLDSAPYGSHTTASDALWMGVPVLTLTGLGFAARVCGSLVQAAGLAELICYTPAEYVTKAVELGQNREQCAAYRQKLIEQRDTCILFDTPSLVRHLEALYADMWAAFRQGRLPRPDLSNLELYQEIGLELDNGGVGVATDATYRAQYRAKLIEKNGYAFIRPDSRLWPGEHDGT
ncbi:MAG: glycosyl transferase [Magnetococcales bacterium]|nr:glycosyl transferase [Magnetococcales bacterium]